MEAKLFTSQEMKKLEGKIHIADFCRRAIETTRDIATNPARRYKLKTGISKYFDSVSYVEFGNDIYISQFMCNNIREWRMAHNSNELIRLCSDVQAKFKTFLLDFGDERDYNVLYKALVENKDKLEISEDVLKRCTDLGAVFDIIFRVARGCTDKYGYVANPLDFGPYISAICGDLIWSTDKLLDFLSQDKMDMLHISEWLNEAEMCENLYESGSSALRKKNPHIDALMQSIEKLRTDEKEQSLSNKARCSSAWLDIYQYCMENEVSKRYNTPANTDRKFQKEVQEAFNRVLNGGLILFCDNLGIQVESYQFSEDYIDDKLADIKVSDVIEQLIDANTTDGSRQDWLKRLFSHIYRDTYGLSEEGLSKFIVDGKSNLRSIDFCYNKSMLHTIADEYVAVNFDGQGGVMVTLRYRNKKGIDCLYMTYFAMDVGRVASDGQSSLDSYDDIIFVTDGVSDDIFELARAGKFVTRPTWSVEFRANDNDSTSEDIAKSGVTGIVCPCKEYCDRMQILTTGGNSKVCKKCITGLNYNTAPWGIVCCDESGAVSEDCDTDEVQRRIGCPFFGSFIKAFDWFMNNLDFCDLRDCKLKDLIGMTLSMTLMDGDENTSTIIDVSSNYDEW